MKKTANRLSHLPLTHKGNLIFY